MLAEDDVLRVYQDTIRLLYAYVSRRVGWDKGLAEDLVQETWMRALDTWPSQGIPDEPAAWLIRVARNTLVSHFRRQRPESIDPALIEIEDERFSPAAPDSAVVVGWGLTQLRRAHADVLEAYYFEGETVSELSRSRIADVEVRIEALRRKLDLRQQFEAGRMDAIEVDLRVLEVDAGKLAKILAQKIALAKQEAARLARQVDVGVAAPVDAAEANVRRLELETELSRTELDLALIRQRIAQHRKR